MKTTINIEVEKLLEGYILTLVSGNKVFCKDLDALVLRIKTEIDIEL